MPSIIGLIVPLVVAAFLVAAIGLAIRRNFQSKRSTRSLEQPVSELDGMMTSDPSNGIDLGNRHEVRAFMRLIVDESIRPTVDLPGAQRRLASFVDFANDLSVRTGQGSCFGHPEVTCTLGVSEVLLLAKITHTRPEEKIGSWLVASRRRPIE